jgi:hypothetical protein
MTTCVTTSSSLSSSVTSKNEYTTDRILYRLQHDKANYKIISNDASGLKSKCWNVFGFPTRKNENGDFHRIIGFVSCQQCYRTFSYTQTTGTRHLNTHVCVINFQPKSTLSAQIISQTTLDNISKSLKQVKLCDKEKNKFKDLMANWICPDMRPFTVIEDVGLRDIFQELICLGKFLTAIHEINLFLGAKYGDFDVKNIVRGADTASSHVYSLADEYRSKLKEILKEPFENEAICISPDMWSDSHKQLSYLGLSCSLVDADFYYKTVDLCCRPYYEVDQSGDNLLSVR